MNHFYPRIILGLFVCVVLFLGQVEGQGLRYAMSTGARAAALGHAFTGVRGDFWALYHNPAGIAGTEAIQLGLHVERRFLLEELNYGSAGVVAPFAENQAIGLQVGSFGFDAYRENQLALSYGITLLDRISMGVRANYAGINISDQGATETYFVDVGINTAINDQLSLGFQAYNVNQAKLPTQAFEEPLPQVFSLGLAYEPSEKVLLVADVHKDLDFATSYRGGVEYQAADFFLFRLGISNEPLTWNAGFGLVFGGYTLDAAFGFHERLGYTPYLSMSYQFGRE